MLAAMTRRARTSSAAAVSAPASRVAAAQQQSSTKAKAKMAQASKSTAGNNTTLSAINITFLGTASAKPSSTRNHSSLAMKLGGDVWLFDCGESTQKRIHKSNVKLGKIAKIFITHTHGDHIFGLVPLMADLLNGAGGTTEGEDTRARDGANAEPLEIYGPLGTRAYIRSSLAYTHTFLQGRYVVHELRFPKDPSDGDFTQLRPHPSELRYGRNIKQTFPEPIVTENDPSSSGPSTSLSSYTFSSSSNSGYWPAIFSSPLLTVHAAPIKHTVACVGYVLEEAPVPLKMNPANYVPHIKRTGAPMNLLSNIQRGKDVTLPDGTVLKGLSRQPGRKIVILGDTHDPSAIAKIADKPDLLIHESTNAHLPDVDPESAGPEDTYESIERQARSRGHSTPQMAGLFAKRIGAKRLILNHFSSRYKADLEGDEEAQKVMNRIRELAAENFESDKVVCARDFMSVDIELERVHDPGVQGVQGEKVEVEKIKEKKEEEHEETESGGTEELTAMQIG